MNLKQFITLIIDILIIIFTIKLTMNNITITKVEINKEHQNQIITMEVFGHEWEYFIDNEDIEVIKND